MSGVEGRLAKILRNKATVITRAVFWKISHKTKQGDVRLKLGRYKKPLEFDQEEEPESLEPKSELTLDQEEFKSLIDFLEHSYEPFRQGVKAFIPLDRPFDTDNAKQIRALFSLPDKQELVRFILVAMFGLVYMLISVIGFMGMDIKIGEQWEAVIRLNLLNYVQFSLGVALSSVGMILMKRQRLDGSMWAVA